MGKDGKQPRQSRDGPALPDGYMPGKQDGKVYVRNQWHKAPKARSASSNLTDTGWIAARTRPRARNSFHDNMSSCKEAKVKARGVTLAMPQGQSWAPTPDKRSYGERGNHPGGPLNAQPSAGQGKARRRLMPPGWGGGPVVVRGRESRPHGEGVQRVRGNDARRGGRR